MKPINIICHPEFGKLYKHPKYDMFYSKENNKIYSDIFWREKTEMFEETIYRSDSSNNPYP